MMHFSSTSWRELKLHTGALKLKISIYTREREKKEEKTKLSAHVAWMHGNGVRKPLYVCKVCKY